MWLNLLQALRHVRRRPTLTLVGISSLAVGIGCALACATVVHAMLFRAIPYRDPDGLVVVWENNAKRGVGLTPTSILNFQDLKAAASTFSYLGACADESYSLDEADRSVRAIGFRVTAGLLDAAGVPPLVGRLFTGTEDTPGAPDVVVLSHGLWQRRFGADPHIVGRTIRLTGVPHTVIGVMPRGFLLPPVFDVRLVGVDDTIKEAELWVPIKLAALPQSRNARLLNVIGRLKPGRSVRESQAELSAIGARLATDYPVENLGLDFTAVPLPTQVLSSVRTLILLLVVVGALVLVIATTDAAHLLLADSLTMTGDTAVRSALGATTWRLASGFGTLSLLWCVLATAGALVVAIGIQSPVVAYAKANVPRLTAVGIDWTVASFGLALGLVLTMAISALPIAYARKLGTARSIQAAPAPVGIPRWRRVFVIVQLAIAVIVLSTGALLYRSADRLARIDPGLARGGVDVFELMLPDARYGTPVRRADFARRMVDAMAAVPGGSAAAVVDYVPFGGITALSTITIENHVVLDAAARPRAALRAISPAYFDALSIPLIDGRRFTLADDGGDARAAIVNDAFARRYLPEEPVIGVRIKPGGPKSAAPWMTIVGIAGSVRDAGLGVEPQPEVFVPYARAPVPSTLTLIVRSVAPLQAVAPAVVQRIHRVDAELSPATITDMRELVARATGQPFFYARLFGVLATVAFLLSLTGVYGVAVLGVSARSHEIAIRSCLGAQRGDIIRLVLRETAAAVGCAVAAGAVGAFVLQNRMAAFVYGVGSTDWTVVAGSALVLSALAVGSVYVAARRVVVLRPLDLLKHGAGALA